MTVKPSDSLVDEGIPINTAIVSVSNKSGLETFIPGLIEIRPNITIISTGGTYRALEGILGESASEHLVQVSVYTGVPEMLNGRVKTLHPKVHGGLLAERHHPDHPGELEAALKGARFVDLAVVNLYPFEETIAKAGATFRTAIENIDIGGPTMIRAAAKNFPSCAVLYDPEDYISFLEQVRANGGCTTFDQRLGLAGKVFKRTHQYDRAIDKYWEQAGSPDQVRPLYKFVGEEG